MNEDYKNTAFFFTFSPPPLLNSFQKVLQIPTPPGIFGKLGQVWYQWIRLDENYKSEEVMQVLNLPAIKFLLLSPPPPSLTPFPKTFANPYFSGNFW